MMFKALVTSTKKPAKGPVPLRGVPASRFTASLPFVIALDCGSYKAFEKALAKRSLAIKDDMAAEADRFDWISGRTRAQGQEAMWRWRTTEEAKGAKAAPFDSEKATAEHAAWLAQRLKDRQLGKGGWKISPVLRKERARYLDGPVIIGGRSGGHDGRGQIRLLHTPEFI
jgi:hypothetical protein